MRREYLLSAAVICLFLALLVVLAGYLWAHPGAMLICRVVE